MPLILSTRGVMIDGQGIAAPTGCQASCRPRGTACSDRSARQAGAHRRRPRAGNAGGARRPRRAASAAPGARVGQAALAARTLFRCDREYARSGDDIVDRARSPDASPRVGAGRCAAHDDRAASGAGTERAGGHRGADHLQRFFPRYLHLGGMSGTLLESAPGCVCCTTAASRRYTGADQPAPLARRARVRPRAPLQWAAVVTRTREFAASGRPVLIGTDSVARRSCCRSTCSAGVAWVLNALQNADEAARIARAGQRGAVTVATSIAGRGTTSPRRRRARAGRAA